ncbi:MAG: imidazole glycerol phosphate synthase subunit HisH [Gemmatimonadaceae bacterium]
MQIAIFDYGAGNLHSLVKAISGVNGRVVSTESDVRAALRADVLVLPGVGAFGAAATAMRGAQQDLRSALADGQPCLGICLGMQILFDASEESAGDGIGLIPGKVRRLRTTKVPHMGWNDIEWAAPQSVNGEPHIDTAYFANAFVCEPAEESSVLAWTNHEDVRFASVVRRANTVGVQFHPEKSSLAGRAFVNAVIEDLIRCR